MNKSALGHNVRFAGLIVRSSVLGAGLFASVVLAQSQTGALKEIVDLPVTVKSGDTFSSILVRELNSLEAWGEVARYNKLDSPDQIKAGDTIVIPAKLLRLRNYATVVFAKGAVTHHDNINDSRSGISKGDRIYSGDMIETDEDGFVSVSFNGGSSVNIQPESTMKINVLECVDRKIACEINLESDKGELGLDVQSVGFEKPTVFNINTPYASAAVRGTRFDFDINDGNILGVTEGTVEIAINGVSNNINGGKGVLAGEGKSINDLFDLLKQPEFALRDDVNRISSEDLISWQPIDSAANYLVAYVPSESIHEVLHSTSETKTFTKPDLPLGEFVVSARGVASNGLRGYTSTSKLLSVSIDEEAAVPLFDIIITGNEMQITATDDAGDDIELKLGHSMETLADGNYIVASEIHHMGDGETLTLEIDRGQNWYIQGRNVLDNSTVSPYGLLYFFEKTGG